MTKPQTVMNRVGLTELPESMQAGHLLIRHAANDFLGFVVLFLREMRINIQFT